MHAIETRETSRGLPVRQLVHRCATTAGQPAAADDAWAELLRRYARTVRAAVDRTLARGGEDADPSELEDLVQEVYCRLLDDDRRRLAAFRGGADHQLRAWLRRVATRVASDHLRRRRRRVRRHRRQALLAPPPPPPSPVGPAEQRMLAREARRRYLDRLRAACGSERDARVLAQVVLAGRKSREVARSSAGALTASGVDSLVHRVRRRLEAEGLRLPER